MLFRAAGNRLPLGERPKYFETGRILDDMRAASPMGGREPPVTSMPPFTSVDPAGLQGSSPADMASHIEAIHQHLRYIYYKFQELENRVQSVESKVY